MSRVIVIEFVSLDGVTQDPDGSDGTRQGGWAFRFGPEAVAGDKFHLGEVLDTGVMLLGRRTWELFAKIWPDRDNDFAAKMNAIPHHVAGRSQRPRRSVAGPGGAGAWTAMISRVHRPAAARERVVLS